MKHITNASFCIIHQQALCAKSGLTPFDNVMAVVTKIVNLISSQALNKQKFDALLAEVNSVYNGLLIMFAVMLLDVIWLSKLMSFTDICQRFNELNVKLQGTNKTIIVMIDLIRAFDAKLHVFRNDIISRNYKYFPNLKKKYQ
ncbi:hypothetical protein AVEN_114701-1 [Araneus ventricosus]|uniref:Uncharacterized protein n=1 Tax=Araneus ventricosus TaxID=182803 RepID=A0A4Y2LTG4_ARAVE|nr:hypothetical protein AVEN_114701-1 [Araneus ventricosus]